MDTLRWRGEAIPGLMLGTVQLGLDYGIANEQGRPDTGKARALVAAAWEGGVRFFDTARAYGESEAVLGRALQERGVLDEARIITKLPVKLDCTDAGLVKEAAEDSINRLGAPPWCLMLHHPCMLDHWDPGLGEALATLRAAGRVRYLGVSLSGLDEAQRCLAHPDMDVVQAPASAWDTRPARLGLFDAIRGLDRLCCVRSVYLQGLLALPPARVAERLPAARPAAEAWHTLAAEAGLPPAELALRYALRFGWPLVVGAETPEQVAGTLAMLQRGPLDDATAVRIGAAMDPLANADVLEPWRWPK